VINLGIRNPRKKESVEWQRCGKREKKSSVNGRKVVAKISVSTPKKTIAGIEFVTVQRY